MTFQVDIRQVIHAFSDALDLVGIDEVQHGKRVAFMAWKCSKALQFGPLEIEKVYHASLLHDCGVSSTQVHQNLKCLLVFYYKFKMIVLMGFMIL